MDDVVVVGQRRRHARLLQAPRVRDPLVVQRVEAGDLHQRGWQPAEILGAQRRSVRLRAVLGPAEVVIPEPAHRRAFEHVAVRVRDVARRVQVVVGHRAVHHLCHQRGTTPLAGHERDDGGEVAPGAVARDRDARRVDP